MSGEPKSCPFCGGPPDTHIDSDGDWEVFCDSSEPCCGNVAARFPTRDQAIAAWNRRASAAEIERLRTQITGLEAMLVDAQREVETMRAAYALASVHKG